MLSIIVSHRKSKAPAQQIAAVARSITVVAEKGIAQRDLAAFRRIIAQMTDNLDRIER
jgi:hypothetical protein